MDSVDIMTSARPMASVDIMTFINYAKLTTNDLFVSYVRKLRGKVV